MATGNSSFDRIATTTLQNHGKEIFDAITTNNALAYLLKQKGNFKEVAGGRSFTHPIFYAKNSSYASYAKMATIATPLEDVITRAEYPIKTLAGSVVLSTQELAENSGSKEKLLDLVEVTLENSKKSMSELVGAQFFKDGTAADDFDGIPHLINTSPSTQTDVGGINPSSTGNTYWRNQVDTNTVTAFNTGSEGLTAMNSMLNSCTFGTQGPKAIITTKTVYGLYEIGLTSNIRYVRQDLADAGFQHLAYTTMPVLFDDNVTAAYMYFIDTDSLWLQVLSKGNFQMTDFEYSHNQLAKIALLYVFGNLTCGSRRTQGLIYQING
jgi:hypothetical protein